MAHTGQNTTTRYLRTALQAVTTGCEKTRKRTCLFLQSEKKKVHFISHKPRLFSTMSSELKQDEAYVDLKPPLPARHFDCLVSTFSIESIFFLALSILFIVFYTSLYFLSIERQLKKHLQHIEVYDTPV